MKIQDILKEENFGLKYKDSQGLIWLIRKEYLNLSDRYVLGLFSRNEDSATSIEDVYYLYEILNMDFEEVK